MLTALTGGKPDRLPITIHQWQPYQLKHHMGGVDQLEAYLMCGLDASICMYEVMSLRQSPDWIVTKEPAGFQGDEELTRVRVETPTGDLNWTLASNPQTTYISDHPVKTEEEAMRFVTYFPGLEVDRAALQRWVDRTGDAGIIRGFCTFFAQAGPWQELCEMMGTENAIFWAMDQPELIHELLRILTEQKVRDIHENMPGLPYDLIECGGGAASSTVISPAMFEEFCVPYDRAINEALREEGFLSVYHTCGGMIPLLDIIPSNATDASETLSPPGVGGDIRPEDRAMVKEKLGSKVALIGGVDQFHIIERGTADEIRADVRHCFETYGVGGGYICSASDHFFEASVENLRTFAEAALDCVY